MYWVTEHDKHHCFSYNFMSAYSTKQEHFLLGKYSMFLTDYLADAKCAEFKWNVCTGGSVEEGPRHMALDPQSEIFGVAFSKAWSSFITKLQE